MSRQVPIVIYFSDTTAQLLEDSYPNILTTDSASLLEVCAGPGTFSLSLINKISHSVVDNITFTITDYSAGMVDAARDALEKRLPNHYSKLNFQIVDVQNIPFPSDAYDLVSCMFGYFVPNRLKAFSEVCRVTKPTSGVSVIGTWKYAGMLVLTENFLKFIGQIPMDGQSSNFTLGTSCSDPVQLTSELIACGFKDVIIHEPSGVFPIPLSLEFTKGWFDNPMVKDQLVNYTLDFLYAEWIRMLQDEKYATLVDLVENVVNVEYTALICFATK
jgi:SAM-dependent methyltransferase